MTAFLILMTLLCGGAAVLAYFKPGLFGRGKGRPERRHPSDQLGEDELLQRRKDDNVGGEGG